MVEIYFKWIVVITASFAAAFNDVTKGKIPNILTMPLFITGLIWSVWKGGLSEFGLSIMGAFVLALPYVILFFFAGGGAGDAKMMGAIGSWVGLEQGLIVLLCVCISAVVLGLAKAILKKQLKFLLSSIIVDLYNLIGILFGAFKMQKSDEFYKRSPMELTMPYGVPIFAGVCAAGGYYLCI